MAESKDQNCPVSNISLPKKISGMNVVHRCSNLDMSNMLATMDPYISTAKGKFGYAIARNVRKIKDACNEFLVVRQELIEELGESEKDENGNETANFSIKIGSPAFFEYVEKIDEYAGIEHDVEIYKIPYDVLPEDMTAQGMLNLEWMLFDDVDDKKE